MHSPNATPHTLQLACNARAASVRTAALCMELPTETADGALPAVLQLLPAGLEIKGKDGRQWTVKDLPALIEAQNAAGDIPLDWEHATEIAAPQGQPAPAAGWLNGWHERSGALYAEVTWTPRGAKAVKNREHRYISPAFLHDKQGNIARLISVGLTNRPNLDLAALNRHQSPQEDPPMALAAAIALALGVAEDADEATALNAVTAIKADLATAKAATPSLDLYVPRGDYDVALNRAETAETALNAEQVRIHDAAIGAEVDAAIAAGKVTPATRDYHLAQCRQEGGLDRFKEFVKVSATIVAPTDLTATKPGTGKQALTDDDLAICSQLDIPVADYQKSLNAQEAAA